MLIDIPKPKPPRTEMQRTREIQRPGQMKHYLEFLAEREPQLHQWLAALHHEDRKKVTENAIPVFGEFGLPEEPKDDSNEESARYVLKAMQYAYGELLKNVRS